MPEYQEEWQKLKMSNGRRRERIRETGENKRVKKQILLEEDKSKIYQFQQMSHYMSKQYCDYKYQKRMKNSMEGVVIFVLLEIIAAMLVPIIYDDLFKWYVYILVVGIIVANLVFVISFAIAYHKNKKYKNITNINIR